MTSGLSEWRCETDLGKSNCDRGLSAPLAAEDLVDLGWVSGWNAMVDPQMGGGCLIQTIYEDLSVVRMGYDGTAKRGILSS